MQNYVHIFVLLEMTLMSPFVVDFYINILKFNKKLSLQKNKEIIEREWCVVGKVRCA